MSIKPPSRAVAQYTVYAIVGTIIELAILVAVVIWGLPYVGIEFPLWGLIILALFLLAFSYYTYTMGRRALNKKLIHEIEAMVGSQGIVATVKKTGCYIKVRGELWKAISDYPLRIGQEVVVVAVEGFKLVVKDKNDEIGRT
jgi:membrane-bound serine protease (ClpP class)